MTSNKLEKLLHLVGWFSWKTDWRTNGHNEEKEILAIVRTRQKFCALPHTVYEYLCVPHNSQNKQLLHHLTVPCGWPL